jgi:hypothetical protein
VLSPTAPIPSGPSTATASGHPTAYPHSFYVSPGGDDEGPGSWSRPWASVHGVKTHGRFGPGDRILFRGGATFQGGLYLDDTSLAGTAANPVTIGSYGGGRATISVPPDGDGIGISDAGAVLIQGLDFVGPYSPDNLPPADATQSAIHFSNTSGQTLDYTHVDDVTVTGVAGMAIQVYADHSSQYRDVSITNSSLYRNYESGLYIYSDWGQVYQFENVYVGHVSVTEDCSIPGAVYPGFPLWMQNVNGGVVEHCLVGDNDLTSTHPAGGSVGIGAAESTHLLFQYDESATNFSNGNLLDGAGFDFDGGVSDSVMQYDYSHDNDGEGFVLCDFIPGSGLNTHNVIRYNTSENDGRRNPYGGIVLSQGVIDNADIYSNTVRIDGNATGKHIAAFSVQDGAVPVHVHVRNNTFVTSGGVPLLSVTDAGTDLLFQGNDCRTNGDPYVIEWLEQSYQDLDTWRRETGQEPGGVVSP